MKPIVPVSKIMTRNVVKLNVHDSLTKAEQLFEKHRIRHIPVVSGSKVVGIISYTDLLKVAVADYTDDDLSVVTTMYNMFSLEQVMTKDVVTVLSYTSIKEVAEIFVSNDFRALPVLYEDKLVGIVTTSDIIKY
ncbi:MAG TPA: CBS domain-containing protein [Flavobacterium sp.]|nr:CBS domain-containing protein [Flavobacterium sp.]